MSVPFVSTGKRSTWSKLTKRLKRMILWSPVCDLIAIVTVKVVEKGYRDGCLGMNLFNYSVLIFLLIRDKNENEGERKPKK